MMMKKTTSEQQYPCRHRDLNWLSFNERVLQEAEDTLNNPLYERIKFLAIYSTNLDEFFRVRVSQLRQMKRIDKELRKRLTLRPKKIVKDILTIVAEQQERFGRIFFEQIIPELAQHQIHLLREQDLNEDQRKEVMNYFHEHVQPHIRTKIVNWEDDDFVFLENEKLYFAVDFGQDDQAGFIYIPTQEVARFIPISLKAESHYYVFIDDLIRLVASSLFPDQSISGMYALKLSRDAELYIDDEFDGILAEKIYQSLAQRSKGQPTRLLYDQAIPKTLRKRIRKLLNLGKIDMVAGGRYHNFKDLFQFPDPTNDPKLHFESFTTLEHKRLAASKNYFDTIREKDLLVHFPYMSFRVVEDFVVASAEDDAVRSIKISLYRVAENSRLTSALIKAITHGKKVTVFIEAKARFDEENNILWGRKLEEQGAEVIYSYPKIKVHSKILLVEREEKQETVHYAYIGTGNFNAETSAIYCDYGLFTARKKLTRELQRVFEVLEGNLIIPRAKRLLISPFNTRNQLERLIHQEIEHARAGRPAKIIAKMNQLEDPKMIRLLYKASQEGVDIQLIVRGFTCLVPGIPGVSDRIQMISIVDRFLEHGRIYYFHNNDEPLLYTGSADWMTRNLDRRIEVLTPVLDPDLFAELKHILDLQWADTVKARIHDQDESNTYVKSTNDQKQLRSQYAIFNYLKSVHQS
ncbi:polyphosphate kinase 1 [Croceiramulus getboli]|nr:polyphosphate kinase 1 [Flavobacteriaceae bacterium YJPT1-3]